MVGGRGCCWMNSSGCLVLGTHLPTGSVTRKWEIPNHFTWVSRWDNLAELLSWRGRESLVQEDGEQWLKRNTQGTQAEEESLGAGPLGGRSWWEWRAGGFKFAVCGDRESPEVAEQGGTQEKVWLDETDHVHADSESPKRTGWREGASRETGTVSRTAVKAGSVVRLINSKKGWKPCGGSVENTWDKKLSMYWMLEEKSRLAFSLGKWGRGRWEKSRSTCNDWGNHRKREKSAVMEKEPLFLLHLNWVVKWRYWIKHPMEKRCK